MNKELIRVVTRLQEIAAKADESFSYEVRIIPIRGEAEFEFICRENADGHEFVSGRGGSPDAAAIAAESQIAEAAESWFEANDRKYESD